MDRIANDFLGHAAISKCPPLCTRYNLRWRRQWLAHNHCGLEVSYWMGFAPIAFVRFAMRLKLSFIFPLLLLMIVPSPLSAQRDAKVDVSIKERAFHPATLRIKKGES